MKKGGLSTSNRKKLQKALSSIKDDPDQAKKLIWDLFHQMKTPPVQTKVVVNTEREEQLTKRLNEAESEIQRLQDLNTTKLNKLDMLSHRGYDLYDKCIENSFAIMTKKVQSITDITEQQRGPVLETLVDLMHILRVGPPIPESFWSRYSFEKKIHFLIEHLFAMCVGFHDTVEYYSRSY